MAQTHNDGDGHGHDHGDHLHPAAPMVEEISDFEILEIAVRELAIEKGLFTAEDHRKFTEWAEQIGPAGGSRLVAKAWSDPAFKQRVLSDAVAACREIGIDWTEPTGQGTPSDYMELRVLEDTPTLHHVIVCTLCSCYPRPLLGHSPYWYRSPNYRRRIVRWPRPVLAEFGLVLPPEVEIRVEDSNQKCRFMVLPMRPAGTEGWTEEQLAEIVTRDCMIGVALPRAGPQGRRCPSRSPSEPPGRHRAAGRRSPRVSENTVPGPAAPDTAEAATPPIKLLDAIQQEGRTWEELAPQYGVTSPDPPWKISLYALFECLSAAGPLPSLERRHIEDRLGETLYARTPDPERQLLTLADTLLRRGLLSEEDIARRMEAVRARFEAS